MAGNRHGCGCCWKQLAPARACHPDPGNDHDMAAAEVPAIPVSAGALIFDRAGRLLILKPTYKTGWTIPGGVMEADGETPWDACRREVREECGIEVRGGRLACVDFRPGRPGHPGGIRFLFDYGPRSPQSARPGTDHTRPHP